MGIFSKFENRMEDTFEGAANGMSKAPITPVQIAKKAEKQMRRETMVGAGKQYAPTLYTVLVNVDDDKRLFGYYPTLAGETETYLSAKAAQEGLAMDGHPLVRFVVDEGLRHGKFDVIAEMVAAPIVEQLRDEEMQRYGIAPRHGGGAPQEQPYPNQGNQLYPNQQPYNQQPYQVEPMQPQGYVEPMQQGYVEPMQQGYVEPMQQQGYAEPMIQPGQSYDYGAHDDVPAYQRDSRGGIGNDDFNGGYGSYMQQGQPAPVQAEPQRKPPLPYVPEEEIDRSISYGEYTFNSADFEDYRDSDPNSNIIAAAPEHNYGQQSQPVVAEQPAQQPANTMGIAGGTRQAAEPTPVRARLMDMTYHRPYDLTGTRITLGRESHNDIVVHDINASRKHAELILNAQGIWTIADLGSMNGTLVNGISVASHPLYPGDIVTIGKTDYQFMLA